MYIYPHVKSGYYFPQNSYRVFNKCMQAWLCFCKKLETVGSKHIFVDVAFMKLD